AAAAAHRQCQGALCRRADALPERPPAQVAERHAGGRLRLRGGSGRHGIAALRRRPALAMGDPADLLPAPDPRLRPAADIANKLLSPAGIKRASSLACGTAVRGKFLGCAGLQTYPSIVMAGLVPAIHVL